MPSVYMQTNEKILNKSVLLLIDIFVSLGIKNKTNEQCGGSGKKKRVSKTEKEREKNNIN